MTKIIKEGKLPVKRMTCDYCGCEFEYDKRDVNKRERLRESLPYNYNASSLAVAYDYSVACPYCHTNHSLPVNILDQLKAENPRKDFEEDVASLARQYGIDNYEIKIK